MSGVVASDPALRQDLRIARSLGVSLRRFWGWEPATHGDIREAEFDAWERALWRAFDQWESDRCPDCGQAMSQSLWRIISDDRPRWRGGYHECTACHDLELAQIKQAHDDEQRRKLRPSDPPPPTRYRKWFVQKAEG